MRVSQFVRFSAITLALLGTIASGVSAAEFTCPVFDSAFRIGGGVNGFPVSSADLKLEGAVGLPEFSLAAWADISVMPSITPTFGGEAKLTRDWLSLSVIAQQNESLVDLTLRASAAPAAWLLVDCSPAVFGGITATVETELLGGLGGNGIAVSPFLTGVIPVGDTVVTPTLGLDVRLNPETQALELSGSRITSTVNAGIVLITNTIYFVDLYAAFSSLAVFINVPTWSLTASGSLTPAGGAGRFAYRVGISYEWGDTYLLSVQAEQPSSCVGDYCY